MLTFDPPMPKNLDTKNVMQGKDSYISKNTIYNGQWVSNKPKGRGILISKNGAIKEGYF